MTLPQPSKGSVFVLEDDAELCQATVVLLSTVGFSVRSGATAAAARDAFMSSVPDVLITDIVLPGEDGLSFLDWARGCARKAGQRFHAIVISGEPVGRTMPRVKDAGADLYLAKPFDPGALLASVIAATSSPSLGPNLRQAFVVGARIDAILRRPGHAHRAAAAVSR